MDGNTTTGMNITCCGSASREATIWKGKDEKGFDVGFTLFICDKCGTLFKEWSFPSRLIAWRYDDKSLKLRTSYDWAQSELLLGLPLEEHDLILEALLRAEVQELGERTDPDYPYRPFQLIVLVYRAVLKHKKRESLLKFINLIRLVHILNTEERNGKFRRSYVLDCEAKVMNSICERYVWELEMKEAEYL